MPIGRGRVAINPVIGGKKTDVDGLAVSLGAGDQARVDLTMPATYHLQGIDAHFDGCEVGDRGWVAVVHPTTTNLATALNGGETSIDVNDASPFSGAAYVEFWNAADDTILEVVKIDSVAGGTINLASAVSLAHATDEVVRARLDGFSPVRGSEGIDGGYRFSGSGVFRFRSENRLTEPIDAGLILSTRLITDPAGSTRNFSINYLFRAST